MLMIHLYQATVFLLKQIENNWFGYGKQFSSKTNSQTCRPRDYQ